MSRKSLSKGTKPRLNSLTVTRFQIGCRRRKPSVFKARWGITARAVKKQIPISNFYFAHAFGIRTTITDAQLANWPEEAQAYVGWKGVKKLPTDQYKREMEDCYAVFWAAWQSGLPLDSCIYFASQNQPPAPLNFMDLSDYNFGPAYQHRSSIYTWWTGISTARIRIYGYAGITRTGFQPGFNRSVYYK